MLRPRIIPCLLVHKGGLVKTQAFKDPKYVGDPINAVRIFNEKEADELMVLDIDATVNKVAPDFGLIAKLAAECRMPLCYGGGVTTAEQAARIVDMGVEKVAISAAAIAHPALLTEMAAAVGTGSFGNAVLRRFLDSDLREIRIFSRDEKKQDDMRKKYNNPKLKFYIGDVRDYQSVLNVVRGVDFIYHAAALKQVPSCEFHPLEAVKTNVLGTENVLEAAITCGVKRVG